MVAKGATLAVVSANDAHRWAEQERGAGWLGVHTLVRAGFIDGEVRHDSTLVGFIERQLTARTHVVFSPPSEDTHQDHAAVAAAVLSAIRRSPVNLIEYETPSVKPGWVPNLWVPMSDADLDEQALALSEHASQRNRPYTGLPWLRARAVFRGQQVGVPLAQTYRVVRVVTNGGML